MASTRTSKERHHLTLEAAAAGILALLVDAREDRTRDDRESVKTEVILDRAGLSLDDIAAVTGKNYNAVRMTIARSRGR